MTHSPVADLDIIEHALADAAALIPEPAAPVATAARYALAGGGKRLRPALVLAAYRACGGTDLDAASGVAASVEVIHTYSLVHDDLPSMDNDDLRRGRPTAHRVFGSAAATLAGAAMIPLAFRMLERSAARLGLPEVRRMELSLELARGAGGSGMVGGQWLDLAAETRESTLEELEEIHSRKTGALIAAAAAMGGIAANTDEHRVAALREYGRRTGLAFQIIDDVLDEVAQTDQLGKTAGRDRTLGKATFPGLLGLEEARRRAKAELEAGLGALSAARIPDEELAALARFAVDRDR